MKKEKKKFSLVEWIDYEQFRRHSDWEMRRMLGYGNKIIHLLEEL